MLSITHDALDKLSKIYDELETLGDKPNLTGQERERRNGLLAQASILKIGANVEEARRWEVNRLLGKAGLRLSEPIHRALPEAAEAAWRAAFNDDKVLIPVSEIEARANIAGSQSISFTNQAAGGAFVPQGFSDRSFESMKEYDSIFDPQFSNVVETETGSNMPFPAIDDVSSESTFILPTQSSVEVDVANFGTKQLGAWTSRSGMVAVSTELLQDSQFPLPAILERAFALRHARGIGKALVNGNGINQPTGLITALLAAGVSPVVASGAASNDGGSETGANSIGTQDIVSLFGKLNAAYRPGACWYLNDTTLTNLTKLLDKMGRPIIEFRDGLPFMMGKPIAICPSFPDTTASSNSVAFGNPYFFVQRRVKGGIASGNFVRVFQQAPELATRGLVAFESFVRVDSGLVAPNSSYLPYQLIQNHS